MTTGGPDTVRVGFPSHGGGSMAIWAASKLGMFARQDLDVGLTLVLGSVNVVEALLAGDVQFGHIPSPAVVEANVTLPGADLVYLASSRVRVGQQFLGTPEIGSIADLKGKRIGTRSYRSDRLTDLDPTLWRYALEQAGLDPERDVEFVSVVSHAAIVDEMVAGRVQAGVMVPPYSLDAQRRGLKVLLDGRDIDIPYQLGGIVTRRSFLERAGDLPVRFLRAYVEGLGRIMTDLPLSRALVRDYSMIRDPGVAAQSVDYYLGVLQYPPLPSVAGIGTVIGHLAERLPSAAELRAEDCVELGPIRQLGAEGLLDRHAPGDLRS